METKDDISYGVVPLHFGLGVWRVLLIHQISHRGGLNHFWTFPKGHGENNETPTAAALRELREETGLTDVTLEEVEVFSTAYTFTHDNVSINKKVEYYIGYCNNQETTISQPHEVTELKWCTFEEAEQLLAHQNSKNILLAVRRFLKV